MSLSVVKIQDKKEEDIRWPVDRLLENINEYEEVFILAKKKDGRGFERHSSSFKDSFWWVGALEALKQELLNPPCMCEGEK